MIDFQQKRKIKKAVYSKLSLVVLVVFILFLLHSTYGIYVKERFSAKNLASVQKDYDNLKSREEMLNSEISRLQTEEGMEEDIRNKFSVAKPGEELVVIVDKESSTTEKENEVISFWQRLADFFK